MHNTHFIFMNGVDEDDARYKVENELSSWGDENNWFDIERVIDLSNLQENADYITGIANDLNEETSPKQKQNLIDTINHLQSQVKTGQKHIYWQLSEYYKQLYYATDTEPYTLNNIVEGSCSEYYPYQYDEFGITDLSDDSDEQLYLVEVDMHS